MLKKFGQFLFSWEYVAWLIAVLVIICLIVPILRIDVKEEEQWRFLSLVGVVFTLGVIAAFLSHHMR
ncbi:MAG: hypothetical protein HZB11_00970 [Candidatus Yonathbacteria bacterium]|nr:hypothetical protein [Candidatus Yonathbacteria bacterium]